MTAVCNKIVFGVALFLAAVSNSSGQSQRPPETPNVQTDQQSISPGKSEPKSNEEIKSTADATSEFWSFPIIGHRLKITGLVARFFHLFGLSSLLFGRATNFKGLSIAPRRPPKSPNAPMSPAVPETDASIENCRGRPTKLISFSLE